MRHEPRGAAVLVDDDRHLDLLALELLQQLGHALGLGHERRRPDEPRDRTAAVGVRLGVQDQVLDEDDAEDVVEVLVDRPGCASTPARGRARAARRASRPPWIATMSGRGVMTSRTSVSPKSTIDCSSRRSSRSISPCSSPASR